MSLQVDGRERDRWILVELWSTAAGARVRQRPGRRPDRWGKGRSGRHGRWPGRGRPGRGAGGAGGHAPRPPWGPGAGGSRALVGVEVAQSVTRALGQLRQPGSGDHVGDDKVGPHDAGQRRVVERSPQAGGPAVGDADVDPAAIRVPGSPTGRPEWPGQPRVPLARSTATPCRRHRSGARVGAPCGQCCARPRGTLSSRTSSSPVNGSVSLRSAPSLQWLMSCSVLYSGISYDG